MSTVVDVSPVASQPVEVVSKKPRAKKVKITEPAAKSDVEKPEPVATAVVEEPVATAVVETAVVETKGKGKTKKVDAVVESEATEVEPKKGKAKKAVVEEKVDASASELEIESKPKKGKAKKVVEETTSSEVESEIESKPKKGKAKKVVEETTSSEVESEIESKPKGKNKKEVAVDEEKPKVKRGRKPKVVAETVDEKSDEEKPKAKRGRKPKVVVEGDDDVTKKERKPRNTESLDELLSRTTTEGEALIAEANERLEQLSSDKAQLEQDIAAVKLQEKDVVKLKNKLKRDINKLDAENRPKKFEALEPEVRSNMIRDFQEQLDLAITQHDNLLDVRLKISSDLTVAKREEKKAQTSLSRLETKLQKDLAKIQVRIDKKNLKASAPKKPRNTKIVSVVPSTPTLESDNDNNNDLDNNNDNDNDDDDEILTRETLIDGQPFLIDQHNNLYHPTSHLFLRSL